MGGRRTLLVVRSKHASIGLALALCACGEPHACAQPAASTARAFDPAYVSAPPALTCLPYGTGAIQQAVHLGADRIAITRTLDPLLPTGYDGMDSTYTLDVRRTSDLGVIWARVLGSPPNALAASEDGLRVAVGTHVSTRVLDGTTATLAFEHTGETFALAYSPSGELAIADRRSVVVVDSSGTVTRTIEITGSAPTVIHAMDMDGECHEIFDDTEARAEVVAFAADGTLVAGVSDGSVRALGTDDSVRWMRPFERSWGYRTTVAAFERVSGGTVRATYGDAFAVTLRARTMSVTATAAAACTGGETAVARRRLGAAVEGEPITCAYARSMDVDGSGRHLWVAPVTRVHGSSGGSLLTAPTLHTEAGLLVGDEAWLFGIDGTGERWSLGSGGGTFRGALPIPGRTGPVLDVSADGRWVAIGTMPLEAHGSETNDGYELGIVDTRSETVLALTAFGARARFVPGRAQVALEIIAHARRAVEIRELPGGARVRRVELAAAEYGGLVAVDAQRLVVAEGPHVRVIELADGSERAIDLPPCAIEAGSLVGDRLAMRVYDQTTTDIGHHRIEILDLAGEVRSLRRVDGASGHDVELVEGGAAAVYAGADGVAHRLDVATGTITDLAGITAGGVSGVASTGRGLLYARRGTAGAPVWLGTTQSETTLLDWTRGADHAGAAIAYELGGSAYVIGHDGHTRATLHAIDGGLVVRSVSGAFSVTPGSRAALSVRDGDALRACDSSMEAQHVPGLLEALLAP